MGTLHIAVVCPTRDRPGLFLRTLQRVCEGIACGKAFWNWVVVVLDDSTRVECEQAVRKAVHETGSALGDRGTVVYVGRSEWGQLYSLLRLRHANLDAFVRPLGQEVGDISSLRNLGVLWALSMLLEPFVFVLIDDDIVFSTPTDLQVLASAVVDDQRAVIGPRLCGQPDLSLLERLLWSAGVRGRLERLASVGYHMPVSGGCCAFSTGLVMHAFPRAYNEDWLWMIRVRLNGGEIRRISVDAVQDGPVPIALNVQAIERQQWGEVLFEGWRCAKEMEQTASPEEVVLSVEWWKGILRGEVRYLQRMQRMAERLRDAEAAQEAVQYAIALASTFNPACFSDFSRTWLGSDVAWRRLLDDIRSRQQGVTI